MEGSGSADKWWLLARLPSLASRRVTRAKGLGVSKLPVQGKSNHRMGAGGPRQGGDLRGAETPLIRLLGSAGVAVWAETGRQEAAMLFFLGGGCQASPDLPPRCLGSNALCGCLSTLGSLNGPLESSGSIMEESRSLPSRAGR